MSITTAQNDFNKKLEKQRAAQQRQFERQKIKQRERVDDAEYQAAQKAKQFAAQKKQRDKQVAKQRAKLNDPAYHQKCIEKQQQAFQKQKAKSAESTAKKTTAKKPSKPLISKGMKGRTKTAEEKRLEKKLGSIGCICCLNQGWYTEAMRDSEGEHFISMHHVAGRTKPWAHAMQLPLCHYHHQTPAPKEAPKELFPIHGNAINTWEKINGTQTALLEQAYNMINEIRPWLETQA